MQVEGGGVTTPKGFKAAGIYGALRSKGVRPDLTLILADEPVSPRALVVSC